LLAPKKNRAEHLGVSGPDPPLLVQEYEELRRDALGALERHARGLAVFVHKGMAAWMQACATGTSSFPFRPSPEPEQWRRLRGLEQEVVDVVVAMVLSTASEVRV
jgi:hypothetical protein